MNLALELSILTMLAPTVAALACLLIGLIAGSGTRERQIAHRAAAGAGFAVAAVFVGVQIVGAVLLGLATA